MIPMTTVPTVTTYGKRVVVTREGSFVEFTMRSGALAENVAKGLRGCLADAYHAGRAEEAEERRQAEGAGRDWMQEQANGNLHGRNVL